MKTPRRLLRYVREHPGATRKELCQELDVPYMTVNSAIHWLRKAGLLERPIKGVTMGRCWPKGHFSRREQP